MIEALRLPLLLAAAALIGLAASASAAPDKPAKTAAPAGKSASPVDLGSSKEPIKIDADRLDVFDKEGRAVFSGNVIAIQGETTMKCVAMDVFYEKKTGDTGEKTQPTGTMSGDSSIRRIECKGPVTVTTKTQTGTGDRAEFDRVVNKVFLIGNAALADGPNVIRGERVAYDLGTGIARVEGGAGRERVRTLIVPGSQDKDKDDKKKKSTN